MNLLTDPRNCGAVGRIVPAARFATVGCKNGATAITKCAKGRYDLDRMVANGCESTVPPAPTAVRAGQLLGRQRGRETYGSWW